MAVRAAAVQAAVGQAMNAAAMMAGITKAGHHRLAGLVAGLVGARAVAVPLAAAAATIWMTKFRFKADSYTVKARQHWTPRPLFPI